MRLPIAVRRATSRLLEWIPVRIRQGVNAGMRWSLPAAGRHLGGRFEADRVAAIGKLLEPGACFWDIGAHHGYVTLMASRIVGDEGVVCSFEPSRYNFRFLQRHVGWNAPDNVRLGRVAVAGENGTVHFGGGGSSQTFKIGGGRDEVEAVTIDGMLEWGVPLPDVIKIDTEGAEAAILESGARHIPRSAVVVVAIHSLDLYRRCVDALETEGFCVFASEEVRRSRALPAWPGHDPDIIAVGPEGGEELLERVAALPGFEPD